LQSVGVFAGNLNNDIRTKVINQLKKGMKASKRMGPNIGDFRIDIEGIMSTLLLEFWNEVKYFLSRTPFFHV